MPSHDNLPSPATCARPYPLALLELLRNVVANRLQKSSATDQSVDVNGTQRRDRIELRIVVFHLTRIQRTCTRLIVHTPIIAFQIEMCMTPFLFACSQNDLNFCKFSYRKSHAGQTISLPGRERDVIDQSPVRLRRDDSLPAGSEFQTRSRVRQDTLRRTCWQRVRFR